VNITVIGTGKIKETYLKKGIAEYERRLRNYGRISIVEVKDEAISEPLSDAGKERILDREAQRIEAALPRRSFVIALDRRGAMVSSEEWAMHLQKSMNCGHSHFVYLIGGALGLHERIKESSHWVLSFSRLTFPHQLMRLILLEQLYRTASILAGQKYHK